MRYYDLLEAFAGLDDAVPPLTHPEEAPVVEALAERFTRAQVKAMKPDGTPHGVLQ